MNRIVHPLSLAECTSTEMEWNLRRTQPHKKPRMEVFDANEEKTMTLQTTKENPEATTDVRTLYQFEKAMTRLGYTFELVDLIPFKSFNRWTRRLMMAMNQDNLLSTKTLTVQDCSHANDLLFRMMEVETRYDGIRRELSSGKAPLEEAMTKAMNSLMIERA